MDALSLRSLFGMMWETGHDPKSNIDLIICHVICSFHLQTAPQTLNATAQPLSGSWKSRKSILSYCTTLVLKMIAILSRNISSILYGPHTIDSREQDAVHCLKALAKEELYQRHRTHKIDIRSDMEVSIYQVRHQGLCFKSHPIHCLWLAWQVRLACKDIKRGYEGRIRKTRTWNLSQSRRAVYDPGALIVGSFRRYHCCYKYAMMFAPKHWSVSFVSAVFPPDVSRSSLELGSVRERSEKEAQIR